MDNFEKKNIGIESAESPRDESSDQALFLEILRAQWPELSVDLCGRVADFRNRVLVGNQTQNLTRITSPADFYWGHVRDVQFLLQRKWLGSSAMDLGSGVGVPGLLAGLVDPGVKWYLAESEGRKAEFLNKTVDEFGVSDRIEVFSGRAEAWLANNKCETVVTRAVGSLIKIWELIGRRSTWNTLIMFKGPKWDDEWDVFSKSPYKKSLNLLEVFEYSRSPVGAGGGASGSQPYSGAQSAAQSATQDAPKAIMGKLVLLERAKGILPQGARKN